MVEMDVKKMAGDMGYGLVGIIKEKYGTPGSTFNDFDLVEDLKKLGYDYDTELLVNTPTQSSYRMDIFDDGDKIAEMEVSSEAGMGTMMLSLREVA